MREHQAAEAAVSEVTKEDDEEKQVRGQDERVMIPKLGKNLNSRGDRVRGLKRGEEGAYRDKSTWDFVVELVQTEFRDRVLVDEATWKAVVLILKGGGDYHVICFVEVVWNAVTVILNFCFSASITYHDSLRGFRSGRSTGTAHLEVKLFQKVMDKREEVL